MVEVSGRRGLYEAALRTVTDWETLAGIVERFEKDHALTLDERDELEALADRRDRDLRPVLWSRGGFGP